MSLIDRDYMGDNPKSDLNTDEIRRRHDAEIYETIIAQKTRTKYHFFTNVRNDIYNKGNQPDYEAAKGQKEYPWDKNDDVKQQYARPDYEAAKGQKEYPWGKNNDAKSQNTQWSHINNENHKNSKRHNPPPLKRRFALKKIPFFVIVIFIIIIAILRALFYRPYDFNQNITQNNKTNNKTNINSLYSKQSLKNPKDYAQYINWIGEGTEFTYSSSIPDKQLAYEAMYYKLCTTDASDISTLPDFRGKTQYDTAFNIYRYVVDHMDYNRKRMVSDKSIRLSPNMLINIGTGVCRDYSELFAALCIYYNIKVAIVSSDKMNHTWNQVKLDNGKLLYIDATWGDGDVIADEDLYNCTVILKDGWFIEENGVKRYGPINYTNVPMSFIKDEKKQKGIKDVKYNKVISKGSVYNIGYQKGYFSETGDKFKTRPKDQKVYWLN